MRSDVKGCSSCAPGSESYESFTSMGRKLVQYDYRTPEGKLFSCVAKSLHHARMKRNAWIEGKS